MAERAATQGTTLKRDTTMKAKDLFFSNVHVYLPFSDIMPEGVLIVEQRDGIILLIERLGIGNLTFKDYPNMDALEADGYFTTECDEAPDIVNQALEDSLSGNFESWFMYA